MTELSQSQKSDVALQYWDQVREHMGMVGMMRIINGDVYDAEGTEALRKWIMEWEDLDR